MAIGREVGAIKSGSISSVLDEEERSMSVFTEFQERYEAAQEVEMSFHEYLEECAENPMAYASAAERMLHAIGEPKSVDTSRDPRMGRIFNNRIIKVYEAFSDYYGNEDAVESLVAHFRHAAQGLEESKQILYLLGPVGGGKSSLAEKLKALMESVPIYAIKGSPIHESPLGLFDYRYAERLEADYGISRSYLSTIASPWAVKRLRESGGDMSALRVVRLNPSVLAQIAIAKTEPGDENNQDISALVGKANLRRMDEFDQDDPDCYSYSGGLCKGNRGILEFVEMFKAPIKVLNPLLTATQERNYKGTEAIGAIPWDGVVVAHCFSDDTEILTQNGWKTHDEIAIGDPLATMNRETGAMEYQPALQKFEQDYSGPMYHFLSSAADHLVTPNHKMIYHTQYTSDWRDVTAEDFGETGKIMPVAALSTMEDMDISDEEIRLMVWVIADGSLQGKNVRFHLKKQRKIDRLTSLLDSMNMEWRKKETDTGTTNIYFKADGRGRSIPDWYHQLSARQALVLLTEYAHTDGHRKNGEDGHWQLSTNKKDDADKLQHLAFIAGCKAAMCSHQKGRYTPQHFLSVRVGVTESRGDYVRNATEYHGKVFCFETENHTLVARRNGKVLVTGNSNESEWQTFRNNTANEAFLDRVNLVRVPYTLRVDEEVKIYEKLVRESSLKDATVAPFTFETAAKYAVLTRLFDHENSPLRTKMLVYNGEDVKAEDVKAKSITEYRDVAGPDEGMSGTSTRFISKRISQVFNCRDELAANPIDFLNVVTERLDIEQLPADVTARYKAIIKEILIPDLLEDLEGLIQSCLIDSYGDYAQGVFARYIQLADAWLEDTDYRDPETGAIWDREYLNKECTKIEKPAGIANPKDYRTEVVRFVLRFKAENGGDMPRWRDYEKLRNVIEKYALSTTDKLLPLISFREHESTEDAKKHGEFVTRMMAEGMTRHQVQLTCEWVSMVKNSN
jgi:predicted Ser/Thr protein kinase